MSPALEIMPYVHRLDNRSTLALDSPLHLAYATKDSESRNAVLLVRWSTYLRVHHHVHSLSEGRTFSTISSGYDQAMLSSIRGLSMSGYLDGT